MPAVGGIVTNNGKEYPGYLTLFVVVTCVVAPTGGLIFGYKIGISRGGTTMEPFLKKFFPLWCDWNKNEESSMNQCCHYDSTTLTMFTSSLYLAAVLASRMASKVTRKSGRTPSSSLAGSSSVQEPRSTELPGPSGCSSSALRC